jgi:putative endonuclease
MCPRTGLPPPDDDRSCRWSSRIDNGPHGRAVPARTRLARSGERLAAAHLVAVHGLELVALNHRVSLEDVRGELDVVARDPRTGLLVVCEVKSRSGRAAGGALVTLGRQQQARIRRMTAVLLATGALHAARVRFDLVAVDVPTSAAGPGGGGPVGRAELVHLADAW